MRNQDILTSFEGLQKLRQAATMRLPARTSFAIVRNIKTLQPIVEDIQSTYNDLVRKYAEPVEDNQYKVKESEAEIFSRELTNLYNYDTEVTLMKIHFSDIEALDFSIEEIEALYFMIDDGEA